MSQTRVNNYPKNTFVHQISENSYFERPNYELRFLSWDFWVFSMYFTSNNYRYSEISRKSNLFFEPVARILFWALFVSKNDHFWLRNRHLPTMISKRLHYYRTGEGSLCLQLIQSPWKYFVIAFFKQTHKKLT